MSGVDSEIQTQEHKKQKRRSTLRMADESAAECLFERLRHHQQRSPDSVEVARALTARISNRLSSHDKHVRQFTLEKLWNPQSGAIQMLLSLLENSRDSATTTYITSILRETLCLKQGKGKKNSVTNEGASSKRKEVKKAGKENKSPGAKKASVLARQQSVLNFVSINGTQAVIQMLIATHMKRDGNVSTELMTQDLVWILGALGPKDPKFAMKMRMLGCVRTMHMVLKGHYTDNKIIFPLLVIMKQLAKNPITTSILIRDGVVSTYERVLVSLGFIPTARLRLCLDAIDYFSKNKAGRRALCTKKHVQTLHRFCSQCPDEPEFDSLLARVCSVITLCLKHQTLPVPVCSPATFNLNHILKGTNTSWPCHEDEDANSDVKSVGSEVDVDELPETDSDLFEFPDLEFDESETNKPEPTAEQSVVPFDPVKMFCKSGDSLQSASWNNPHERDIEDLKRYFVYFKEFGSYSKQLKLVRSRSNSRGSILDDYLSKIGGSKTLTSSLNISLSTVLGNAELETIGTSQQLFGHSRLQDSNTGSSNSSLKIHREISRFMSPVVIYGTVSARVRSVIPFVKVAYPDMMGGSSNSQPEPLNKMERNACRTKLLCCVDRAINPESYMNEVVYDLDQLCSVANPDGASSRSFDTILTNNDEQEILKINSFASRLTFESRFESGNLRKAIQIGPREYELILMPDVNSNKRHQWFYFEVRHMQAGRPYVFNIVNCEKSDSQFNFGMKPVMYSVKDAVQGKPGWVRTGTDICYYRNSYHYANQKNHNKCYLTVTFNITFPHNNDVVYLAYHFPYTYSMMMTRLWQWSAELPPGAYLRVEPLCFSLNSNEVPLVTVTADDAQNNPISEREIVFLSARVHPGESNASWVMDGTLGFLLGNSPAAAALRSKYVMKVVPMLNVEGVINGCHRCGLTNEDLNRRWSKPSPVLHPTIYHTKGLIEYLVRVWKKPPLVYCDYHGHSRKKNVFFYGCANAESWCPNDRQVHDEPVKYLMLPALMHRISPAFALGSCSFRIERERESTARVTVWRHLGVTRSYTMEASFCGFDRGPYKGLHLNTQHLQNVGSDFCEALNNLGETANNVDINLTKDLNGNIVEIEFERRTRNYSEVGVDSEEGSGSDSALKSDSDEDFD